MRYLTAGESHGPALTAIVDGVPAGLKISEDQINSDLARRQSGYGRGGRQAIERDRVRVTSRRGQVETWARVSGKTNPGETWMPFHFQDANSNWLTNAALDRVSKAPEYKVCAVRVEKA